MELSQVLQALRNADAAGDVEGAKRLAQIAQQLASGAEEPPRPKEKEPESGFLPSLKASTETLKGDIAALAGRAGLMNVQKAEEYQKAREAEAQKIYRPTEKGYLEAPLTKIGELLGGSLPYMAAPLAAGLLAPEGLAGLAATGAVSATQFAGSNLARQMQEGKGLAQTNLSNAALAAVPQAALDVLSLKMIPGIKGIFGEAGTKLSNAEAKRIAEQGLSKTLGDYALQTGKTAGIEGTTEAAQQVFERLQAGLALNDPQARQEYFDNFLGGAVLGGALAPAGRYIERSQAKGQNAQVQQEEQKQEQIKALKAQQEADALEEQRKQNPAYMQSFVESYETLQEQYKALQKQTKKPDMKTAVPADIEQYNQNREQLAEMRKKLTADSQEYLKLRPVYNQIRTQQQAQAQQEQDQRYQQMEMEGAKNQPTADTAYYESPQGTLPGIQPAIDPTTGEPVAQAPEKQDPRVLYEQLQILQREKDRHQQEANELAASGDHQAWFEFSKQNDAVNKAYLETKKALDALGGYKPEKEHPTVAARKALTEAVTKWQTKSKVGTLAYDPDIAAREYPAVAAAQEKYDAAVKKYGEAFEPQTQEGFDFGPASEFKSQYITSKEQAAAMRYKPGTPEAEAEEQALIEEQRRKDEEEQKRIAAEREEYKLSQEPRQRYERLNEMGRYAEFQGPQMDFNLSPELNTSSAAMGQMQQNLLGIEPGTDLLHTAKEEKPREFRKSPTEPYRGLYASPTEEPAFTPERKQEMRADLERRLASVMARYEMPQGTYDLLRRAENALAVPNPDTDFMRTLDAQLKEIESGREGMPRKGAAVPTQDLQSFPIDKTAVGIRVPKEPERPVLRGASAKPAPLSRESELRDFLRASEEARGEGPAGTKQIPLFPEEEEKLGTVRANPAQFQRFLNSDKVKKLRLALDKDLGELQKLSTVDELKARADALTKQVEAMESVNLEYAQAQRTLRHQRDVGKQRHDINQLRQALVSGVLRRMDLQGKLDELIKARNEIEAQAKANHIGGWDGFDPDLHANLEHVQEEYQRAVNEVAEMQGALSTLDGRLKVEEARIKIAKLNPLTTPKEKLAAAKEELNAARVELGEAQKATNAELVANKAEEGKQRRADEAVAKAKADKIRDDIAKERQERLEAAYNPATRGVEYPAILDAQRMAKELPAQERQPTTNAEEQAIRGNPMKVLGGYKSDVTKLEKKIQQSQTKSKNARLEGLSELRDKADTLNKQYKETASSAERAELLPQLEAAEKAYDEEVNKLVDEPITWVGMAKDIRDLAVAINRADRLEARIESGDVEVQGVIPAKQRKTPVKSVKRAEKTINGIKDKIAVEKDEAKKAKLEERLATAEKFLATAKAEEAQRNTQATKAAQETAGAAKTTEPALTKSEVKKATKQGNTTYTSKGVGEEIQNKLAEKIKTKAIIENDKKYEALKAKKPSELNAMEKAFIQMYDYKYGGKSSGLADKILAEDKKNIKFSRGSTTNGLTKIELQKELDKALGEKGFTAQERFATTDKYGNPTPSKLGIYESVEDFLKTNPDYEGLIPQDAKGFAEGQNAYLFANNIEKGQALGVLLHEVGTHIGFKNFFTAKQYSDLVNTVKGWAKLNDGSIEAKVGRAAMERVKEANTLAEQVDDELLAYAVEEAVKAGIKPEGMGALKNWLNKVVQAFKNALAKLGFAPEKLSAGDLVNFAYGCANLELRGTWHGSDASFTAFDKTKAGKGEGAFDRRFENNLGKGPYVTPDKEYAEYYQQAVPFGKAANSSGYGNKTYQDYRALDDVFSSGIAQDLPFDMLQNMHESMLLTRYLTNVSSGGELDPTKNKAAQSYIDTVRVNAEKKLQDAEASLASKTKRKVTEDRLDEDREKIKYAQRAIKVANQLDVSKIKGLKERPAKGNLYRTLDDIPRKNIYSVNSSFVYGERPALDALLQKYGDVYAKRQVEKDNTYPANGLFYDMYKNLGIEKTTQLLRDAGIEAIEQKSDRRYTERAYIDQVPEIFGTNLAPVGVTEGLLFSRKAQYNNAEFASIGKVADKFIAKEKTFADKIKANTSGLAFETQVVDRFAGFERLSRTMDSLKGSQMMYYLRMYDEKMQYVAQAVEHGALHLVEKIRADGRKEYVIEAKDGPSLASTVKVLKEAKDIVGNGEAVNRLFTLYISAIRAKDKGFSALHFGNNLTQAELNQAFDKINANEQLKDIFDRARNEYNAFNRNQLEFVAQSGALSKETVARLLKENDYIPWYRERNGVAELIIGNETPIRVGSIAEQPYLHDLVGGDAPILDFMTSSVQNTNLLADMALGNLAKKNAVFELVNMDLAVIGKNKGATGPDVVKFKVDGEDRFAIIDTDKVGIPADILVKGMEGIPTQMPFVFRMLAIPAKLIRKTVAASPLQAAKQLFRDSLAAPILAGADFTPVLGSLREINSATKATLERRGITGGQVFTGTNEDLSKILRDIANGKPGWLSSLSRWEALSMEADAATRRAQYNSYIKQGLSEMEATLLAVESMNFSKRGASPSIHIISSLIPFFNAQIQSLNVLYKALTGKMPFNEKLKIQEKLLTRGAMLAAITLAYTVMMQDDEAYKNATPDQKYGNWFIRIPGVDEPIRFAIPFEVGYIFKALPEALYNTMVNKHGKEEAVQAFGGIIKQLIPGGTSYGIPQALRPAIEAGLGKSFYTGRDILSQHEKGLLPEDQFRVNTTEAAKAFGKATGTSPIILDELVRGYTGTMGLAFLQAVSMGIPKGTSPEKAYMRLSEMPVIGGAFQPNDAGAIISRVYDRMGEFQKVEASVDDLMARGYKAEAKELLSQRGNEYAASEIADYYASTMRDLTAYENAVRASSMTPEQKREKLDDIKQTKIKFASMVEKSTDKTIRR